MVNLIKKFVFKDFKLKVLSIILAAMLWFAVSYMGETKMSFSVKIGFEKLGKELIINKIENEEVLVTVDAPVSILKAIRARDIRLVLNLSDFKEGRHVYNLNTDDVQVPKGVKVNELKPDYVAIDLDRVVEKKLQTEIRLDKKWSGIYKVRSWTPQFVSVEGSKESLNSVNSISTIPIDGNFVYEEETIEVLLDTKDLVIKKLKPEIIKVVLRRQ